MFDVYQRRYAAVTATGLGILILFYYLSKRRKRDCGGSDGSERKRNEVEETLNKQTQNVCETGMPPVTFRQYAKSDQGRDASGEISEDALNASGETTNIKLDVHVSALSTESDLHSDFNPGDSVAIDEKQYEHIDCDGSIERIAIKTKITKKTDANDGVELNNKKSLDGNDASKPDVGDLSDDSSLLSSETPSWVEVPDSLKDRQLSTDENQSGKSSEQFNLAPTVNIDAESPDSSPGRSPNDSLVEDNSLVIIEDTDNTIPLEEKTAETPEQTIAQFSDPQNLSGSGDQKSKITGSSKTGEGSLDNNEKSSYKATFTWKSSSPAPDHSKEKSPSPSEIIVKDHMITVVSSDNQVLPEHPEDVIGLTDGEIKEALLTSQSSPDSLSSDHAKVLVRLLSHPSVPLQQSALGNISRCAVFTPNQNVLRENGCLPRLGQLLRQQSMALHGGYKSAESQVTAISTAVTNLAVNEQNHKELGDCVPQLVDLSLEEETGESVCLTSLLALTNLSVTSQHHGHYTRLVQRLYELLDSGKSGVKMQALKILVNLSCNVEMVPHLLAAKAPDCLLELLCQDTDEGMVLRWATLLANILHLVREKKLTQSSLPKDDKAPSPETMFSALYGVNRTGQLKNKVFLLSKHSNKEIQDYAAKIYNDISSGK